MRVKMDHRPHTDFQWIVALYLPINTWFAWRAVKLFQKGV